MVDQQETVEFYWDVVCPWCWITSRWMTDVAGQKSLDVNWKLFSLKKINEGRDMPERFRISHAMGLRALRVAATVREKYGMAYLTPASKFWLPWLRGLHPRSQGRQSLVLLDSGGDNWYKTGGCGSSVCRVLGNVVCA